MLHKRFITTTCALALAAAGIAQSSLSKSRVGKPEFSLVEGAGLYKVAGLDFSGIGYKSKLKSGLRAGIGVSLPLANSFSLQSGLFYAEKGTHAALPGEPAIRLRIAYAELPVHAIYKIPAGTGKLIVGAGPYYGFGIGGEMNGAGNPTHPVLFTSEADGLGFRDRYPLRRSDYGADILAGYEFQQHFSLLATVQLGLKNINPTITGYDGDPGKYKNRGVYTVLAYRF